LFQFTFHFVTDILTPSHWLDTDFLATRMLFDTSETIDNEM